MIALRLMTVTVALLFILLQRVDVKVKIQDGLFIKINLNIIAIVLYESNEKRNHIKDIFSSINKLPIFLKSIKYLLTKSNVTLVLYKKPVLGYSPSLITHIGSTLAEQLIISYLIANSKSLRTVTVSSTHVKSLKNTDYLEAFVSFTFIHFIISSMFLLLGIAKNKVKEVIEYV